MINERKGNIELLRIISMLLILYWHGIHHGFLNIERLDYINIRVYNFISWALFWHVDAFILISGYFNIKFSWSKIAKLFSYICLYIILIDVCIGHYGLKDILISILQLIKGENYWFIKSYLILTMLSPALNLIKNLGNKDFNNIFIIFSFVNIILGFLLKNGYNNDGFNVQNFVYLYIVGMSIRRYQKNIKMRNIWLLVIFMLNIILSYILAYKILTLEYCYAYNNPLVICNAVIVFILFSRLNIKNKYINMIAKNVFAVYIITDNRLLTRQYIVKAANIIYDYTHEPIFGLFIWLVVSVIVFLLCITFDKSMRFLSKKLWNVYIK